MGRCLGCWAGVPAALGDFCTLHRVVPIATGWVQPALTSLGGSYLVALVALVALAAPTCLARPDVAPPEYLRELEKLQDQIPPFCNDQVRAAWPLGCLGFYYTSLPAVCRVLPKLSACTARARLHVSRSVEQAACGAAALCFAAQAFAVIQSEYGVPASQVFSSISPEAVAGEG